MPDRLVHTGPVRRALALALALLGAALGGALACAKTEQTSIIVEVQGPEFRPGVDLDQLRAEVVINELRSMSFDLSPSAGFPIFAVVPATSADDKVWIKVTGFWKTQEKVNAGAHVGFVRNETRLLRLLLLRPCLDVRCEDPRQSCSPSQRACAPSPDIDASTLPPWGSAAPAGSDGGARDATPAGAEAGQGPWDGSGPGNPPADAAGDRPTPADGSTDRPALGDGPADRAGPADAGPDRPVVPDAPADRPVDRGPSPPVGRALGDPCTSSDQCSSLQCVDGVCCNSSCRGQCEACDDAASPGMCKTITGVPHRAALPARPPCGGDPACPGTCDGTTSTKCTYPANRCRARSCSATAGEVINEAFCDAAGVCPPVATMSCQPAGNKIPVCNADGVCGQQCQLAPGGATPAPLMCSTGNVCAVWGFETGTTEGWTGVTGSAWNGTPLRTLKNATLLAPNGSSVLAVDFNFTSQTPELIIQLTLCGGGTNVKGRVFSFETYVGASSSQSFSVGPRTWNGAYYDTPNGTSVNGGVWVADPEGFGQTAAIDLQIVLRYAGPYPFAGTAYFDNFYFK